MSWQNDRSNEPMIERVEYVHDLDQWLYNKRAPFPGAMQGARRMPGLQGLWLAGMAGVDSNHVNWPDISGADTDLVTWWASGGMSCLINSTWPGAIVPYAWVNSTPGGNRGWVRIWTTSPTNVTSGPLSACVWYKVNNTATTGQWCMRSSSWYYEWGSGDEAIEETAQWQFGYTAATGVWTFTVRNAGLTAYSITTPATTGQWAFVQVRFTPSTSIEVRENNGTWATNTTSIPATLRVIPNPDYVFGLHCGVGTGSGDSPYIAMGAFAAYVVPDHWFDWYYAITAPLFGAV